MTAGITLRGVQKEFGGELVLRSCDLEISDHEFLVLVGPSGSGKTTLLRIISGLELQTRGDVYFGDSLVNGLEPGDRDIAMVFQSYGLYPHMSVYKNLAFGLRHRKLAAQEIDQRVNNAAVLLGIESLLKRKPAQLSGGQRQRVALGRAIVRDPAVFLLDEPLSNLDAQLRTQMRSEILKIHRTVSATAVYVTHDQVEALTMGDRIAVMRNGAIEQVDTPETLYDRPVNRFVAGFIGTPSMGFVSGSITGWDGSIEISNRDELHIRIPGTEPNNLTPPVINVDVGFRPEAIHLVADSFVDDAAASWVRGTVDLVEPLGSEKQLIVTTSGGSLNARVSRDERVSVGQRVTFGVQTAGYGLHLFDSESGATIV